MKKEVNEEEARRVAESMGEVQFVCTVTATERERGAVLEGRIPEEFRDVTFGDAPKAVQMSLVLMSAAELLTKLSPEAAMESMRTLHAALEARRAMQEPEDDDDKERGETLH